MNLTMHVSLTVFDRYCLEGLLVECGFDMYTRSWSNITYNYYMFLVGFILPVFVIIICYALIVKAVAAQVTHKNVSSIIFAALILS